MTPFDLILQILDISPGFQSALRLRGFGCEMPVWANFGVFGDFDP